MTQAVLINKEVDPKGTRSAALARGVLGIPFPQQYTVPVEYKGEEYLFVTDYATLMAGVQWELQDFLSLATDGPDTERLPHDDLQVVTATHQDTKVAWLSTRD